MSLSATTQILSFENFGSLESHLKALKNKYSEMIKNYEETLGYLLRDTKAGGKGQQKVQQRWALEMQRAMAASPTATAKNSGNNIVKKQESKPKMFGISKDSKKMFGFGNGKDSNKDNKNEKPEASGEWINLDQLSLFIGPKNRGLAEVYFDAINLLKENVAKLNTAISVCSALRAKSSTAGSTSIVVSFANDLPTKIVLKPAKDSERKKYALAFSFAIPSIAYQSK
jgi:hypothetical protein